MGLYKTWFSSSGRKTGVIMLAVLGVIFIGGSVFYATAQRNAYKQNASLITANNLAAESGLSPLPESESLTAASSSFQRDIYCASDDGRRNYCRIDTRGGVRLVRQRSDSACVRGRTWGSDSRGIWVDRGCRADFEVGSRNSDRGRGRDRDRDRYTQTFYCESGDMKRHWCSEGIGGTVRLLRQRSDAACVRGRTWGTDRSGVWVDRGCRADFEVTRR